MSISGHAVAGARAAWAQPAREPDEHPRSPGGPSAHRGEDETPKTSPQMRAPIPVTDESPGGRTSARRRMAEHHEHQQAGMDLMGWVDG